ncbi:hypothetical protein HanXRQr2_Chr02g0084131 [Helianthus annuus]|uniref:Uncharacterized protein n=1 Tax=Helianthus annuus TaxID=4232 RepID=A0A9K3JT00_HELAN|nr:hypothetical protein HanXRQr2_Chr02g0084131 [Helianthus annuus]
MYVYAKHNCSSRNGSCRNEGENESVQLHCILCVYVCICKT